MTGYRLRYVVGSLSAAKFPTIRYPQTWRAPYSTRERAELVRHAMPDPDRWEIEEVDA